jgi:hypothetical protein
LLSSSHSDAAKKSLDENVRTLMELMKLDYLSIMFMPYSFFIGTIKWKIDLEDERRKKMEENSKKRGKK